MVSQAATREYRPEKERSAIWHRTDHDRQHDRKGRERGRIVVHSLHPHRPHGGVVQARDSHAAHEDAGGQSAKPTDSPGSTTDRRRGRTEMPTSRESKTVGQSYCTGTASGRPAFRCSASTRCRFHRQWRRRPARRARSDRGRRRSLSDPQCRLPGSRCQTDGATSGDRKSIKLALLYHLYILYSLSHYSFIAYNFIIVAASVMT